MIVIFNRNAKRIYVTVACNADPAHGIELSGSGYTETGEFHEFRGTVTYVGLSIKPNGSHEYTVGLDDA